MKETVKNFLFDDWKKDAEQRSVIKSLWLFIGVLIVLNFLLFIGWKTAPNKLRIYLPPDITGGAWIKPNTIPKPTVYAFAYQIFTAVNTWTNGGDVDYKRNIDVYKNYFSNPFFHELLSDYSKRFANDALNRKRMMSGISGDFNPKSVSYLGSGTWRVDMKLHIVETVDATVVKDIVMDYPLIISRVAESIQVNPWGLVISGYYKEPARIKTTL